MTITGYLPAIALTGQSIRSQEGVRRKRSTEVHVPGRQEDCETPGPTSRAVSSPGPSWSLLRSDCHCSGILNCFPAVQEIVPWFCMVVPHIKPIQLWRTLACFPPSRTFRGHQAVSTRGSWSGPTLALHLEWVRREANLWELCLRKKTRHLTLYLSACSCEWERWLETDMPCGVYSVHNGCVCIGLWTCTLNPERLYL